MSIWFSLLLALQDKKPLPQDPIKNWKLQHFERTKDGDLVLVAELTGDEAIPIDIEKKIFDVTKLRAAYYTEPKKADEKSQRLDMTADRAHIEANDKLLQLHGNVRVKAEDGSELESSDLELRDRTFRTAEPIRLTNANVTFTGRGLDADEQLRILTIHREGHVEAKDKDRTILLDSNGPMVVKEIEKKTRALVTTSEGTRLQISGQADVTAKSAEIEIVRKDKESVDLEKIRLVDDVVANARGSRITAKEARIDAKKNRAEFTGGVEGDLRPDPEKPPVRLRSDELVQEGDSVLARGTVRITMTGEQTVAATCDTFEYDTKSQAGVMTGAPWVRVEIGESRILSARVLLPGPDRLVLQGPKRVLLKQGEERYAITAKGDIDVSMGDRRIKMVDRCTFFTQDLRLFSDRIDVRLTAESKIEEIRAAGRVRVERPAESATLFGDRMKIEGNFLTLRGWPYAVLERPDTSARMAEIRFDPKTQAFEARRGKERIRIQFPSQRSQ